jgi:hypothetical protein
MTVKRERLRVCAATGGNCSRMVCRLRAAEEREGALKTDVEQLEARLCELAGANAVLSLESESTKSAKAELVQSVAREAKIFEAAGHLQMQVDALEKRNQMQQEHCSKLQQVHCSELEHERQTREDAARDHALRLSALEEALTKRQQQMQELRNAALLAEEADQRGKQRSMTRMNARRLRASLLNAWNRWHEHAKACKLRNSRQRKHKYRVCWQTQVTTWKRWSGYVSEAKIQQAKASQVVRRRINMDLETAFERWRSSAAQQNQLRGKVITASRRWWDRFLGSTLGIWRLEAHYMYELKMNGLRLFQQLEEAQRARAWNIWRQRTQNALSLVSRHLKIKDRVLTRTVGLHNTLLSAVLHCWHDYILHHQTMRAVSIKVACKWHMQTFARCLTAWYHTSANWRRLRHTANKVLKRRCLFAILRPFTAWRKRAEKRTISQALCQERQAHADNVHKLEEALRLKQIQLESSINEKQAHADNVHKLEEALRLKHIQLESSINEKQEALDRAREQSEDQLKALAQSQARVDEREKEVEMLRAQFETVQWELASQKTATIEMTAAHADFVHKLEESLRLKQIQLESSINEKQAHADNVHKLEEALRLKQIQLESSINEKQEALDRAREQGAEHLKALAQSQAAMSRGENALKLEREAHAQTRSREALLQKAVATQQHDIITLRETNNAATKERARERDAEAEEFRREREAAAAEYEKKLAVIEAFAEADLQKAKHDYALASATTAASAEDAAKKAKREIERERAERKADRDNASIKAREMAAAAEARIVELRHDYALASATTAASAEAAAKKAKREIEREREMAAAAEARIVGLANEIDAMRDQLCATNSKWKMLMEKKTGDHEVRVCLCTHVRLL